MNSWHRTNASPSLNSGARGSLTRLLRAALDRRRLAVWGLRHTGVETFFTKSVCVYADARIA
jgi:hypothetical protein